MTIYIASSWKNQHGVEMLTALLREKGHEVISWIENNYGEGFAASGLADFEEWIKTDGAERAFQFDIKGAQTADLVIYYGPAGKDAAAEVGMAYSRGIPIIGLSAKGEDFGLMRKMMIGWCNRYDQIFKSIENVQGPLKFPSQIKEELIGYEFSDENGKEITVEDVAFQWCIVKDMFNPKPYLYPRGLVEAIKRESDVVAKAEED